MNLKERVEESKIVLNLVNTLPKESTNDFNKAVLTNQIAIMESLAELKNNIQEIAMSISNG